MNLPSALRTGKHCRSHKHSESYNEQDAQLRTLPFESQSRTPCAARGRSDRVIAKHSLTLGRPKMGLLPEYCCIRGL